MRVLLSTVGSRGDVQPLVALALELRELGHDASVCAPPGYDELLDGFGLAYFPVGHDLRLGPRKVPGGAAATVAAQFGVLRTAAADCDAIVGAAAMQIASRSIAQMFDIPYVYVAYAPVALPSTRHSPPPVHGPPRPEGVDNRTMWDVDAQWWNDTWRAGLNAERAAIGLDPVNDVRSYVITDRPLLAADPTLAPWPSELGPSEFIGAIGVGATGVGGRANRRLANARPPTALGRIGGLSRRRSTADPVRLRQHEGGSGIRVHIDRSGPRARVPGSRPARVGRPGAIRRFRGLAICRGDQLAGTASPGGRDCASRRLGDDDPGDAGRHTPGRCSTRIRPALLCGTRCRSWHRNPARRVRTHRRLAGRSAGPSPDAVA